jgi:hypothetical protein
MPVDSGTIASQVGAAGGLWTHTPVDWRGNETGVAPPGPAGWPTNASAAIPPAGSNTGLAAGGGAPPPTISAISVTAITTTGGSINFTLAPNSANQVEYGPTLAYGSMNVEGSGIGPQVKPLTGLTTGTLYHYRIRATANGQTTYSSDRTVTTT